MSSWCTDVEIQAIATVSYICLLSIWNKNNMDQVHSALQNLCNTSMLAHSAIVHSGAHYDAVQPAGTCVCSSKPPILALEGRHNRTEVLFRKEMTGIQVEATIRTAFDGLIPEDVSLEIVSSVFHDLDPLS